MADKIDLNDIASFGGAFVVVSPGGSANVETLIIDPTQNAAQFWGILMTRAQLALQQIQDEERQVGGMHGNRR